MQIEDTTDPLRSDTTLLIAALLALGVPFAAPTHCTYELVRGETVFRTVWTLRAESKCKRFSTAAMENEWAANPWTLPATHPLFALRSGLTFDRALSYTPRFTPSMRANVENADTWLEAAILNLLILMCEIPRIVPEGIVRFGARHAAMVPRTLSESAKTRFLKYVEFPSKRAELASA